MSPELTLRLLKEYGDVLPAGMPCIAVQDGWFSLLEHAFAVVMVRHAIGGGPPLAINSVSQHMGVLQIDFTGGDDFIRGALQLATNLSVHICEICGNRVFPRRMHYHYPRCIEHYDQEHRVETFISQSSEPDPVPEVVGSPRHSG